MFTRKSDDYKKAEALMETIAYSFLRGSQHDSAEARNQLGDELVSLASRLSAKERAKLASNPPTIVSAFPPDGRANYQSFLDAAFGS